MYRRGTGYRQVVGCCGHGMEAQGFIKCGEFVPFYCIRTLTVFVEMPSSGFPSPVSSLSTPPPPHVVLQIRPQCGQVALSSLCGGTSSVANLSFVQGSHFVLIFRSRKGVVVEILDSAVGQFYVTLYSHSIAKLFVFGYYVEHSFFFCQRI